MAQALPQQVSNFFYNTAPWQNLPADKRIPILAKSTLVYLSKSSQNELNKFRASGCLVLVQSGEFALTRKDNDNSSHKRLISDGDYFVIGSSNDIELEAFVEETVATVHTAGLVLCIPLTPITALQQGYSFVTEFFTDYFSHQSSTVLEYSHVDWQQAKLNSLCQKQIVSVPPWRSIRDCAFKMSSYNVSSAVICESGDIVGIVTDKDFRKKVVSENVDTQLPVSKIMTANPIVLNQNQDWMDAVCLMSEKQISHIPLVNNTRELTGIITKTDIFQQQRHNLHYLIKQLARAANLYQLTQIAWQIPEYIKNNIQNEKQLSSTCQWLAIATDVMTKTLIRFYQEKAGASPMNYCWLVYGSQARKDQLLASDQDNGLLLERLPNEEENQYFSQMADYVCKGLGKCGIKLCPGNIMASNERLRFSLELAAAELRKHVHSPTPEGLLYINIFLDVRLVTGDQTLFKKFQEQQAKLVKQPIFLAALAREANKNKVPLNLFRRFNYQARGQAKHCLNLKENAVSIINDIVRIYALAEGIKGASTLERLEHIPKSRLASKDKQNLSNIWVFLNTLRMKSQLHQSPPDNWVDADKLVALEKYQLRKALKYIEDFQESALVKFSGGMTG